MDVIRDPDGNWCALDEDGNAVRVFGPSPGDCEAAWRWIDEWIELTDPYE